MIRASRAPAGAVAVALLWALTVPSASAAAGTGRPAVVRRMAPEYPRWARGTGIGTTVDLQVLVGRDAKALRVVVEPYTVKRDIMTRRLRASFDSAAVACVKRWTFRPARRDGRPVAAWLRVAVGFEDPGEGVDPRAAHGRRDSVARARR